MTRFALMFLTVSACIGQGCDLGLQSREEAESESAKNLRIEIGNVVNLKGGELIAGQQAIVVLMFKNISPERMVLPFVDFYSKGARPIKTGYFNRDAGWYMNTGIEVTSVNCDFRGADGSWYACCSTGCGVKYLDLDREKNQWLYIQIPVPTKPGKYDLRIRIDNRHLNKVNKTTNIGSPESCYFTRTLELPGLEVRPNSK